MRALALAVALVWSPHALATEPPPSATENILAITLDGKVVIDTAVLYQSESGDVWLTVEDWKNVPGLAVDLAEHSGLVSARALGLEPTFLPEQQAVDLKVPATLRPRQRLGTRAAAPIDAVLPQPNGVLVDYDVAGRANSNGNWSTSLGHEARFGVGAATVSTMGQLNYTPDGGSDYVRGVTTAHYDDLKRGIAYQAGDVFTPRTNLSGAVNLGGIRIGTDRALRRHHNFLPVPTLGGVVEDASTADLFVNGRKAGQHSLTHGPWEVDHYPVSPGSNAVRVVVRDDFGREQVIEDHFYLSQTNLPRGTTEWEVAAGAVRQGRDDYATAAIAASLERGMTNVWTVGAHLEATPDAQALTVSNSVVLGRAGVLTADVRATQSDAGTGSAAALSYSFRGENWGFNAGHSRYADDHWSLGLERGGVFTDRTLVESTAVSATYHPKGSPFSGSLSAAQLDYSDGTSRQRLDLSGRYRNRDHALGVGVGYTPQDGATAWASYRYNFGQNRSFTATARQIPELTVGARLAGRSSVGSRDVRWAAGLGTTQDRQRVWAQASTNTAKGPVNVELRHDARGTEVSGRFRSSVWLGEGGMATQRPTSATSFLVVEVPGHARVPVSAGGGWGTRTNRNGVAVVPGVMPLVPQSVSIDPDDLDLAVRIENTTIPAVVGRQAGGKVRFEVLTESMLEVWLTHRGQPLSTPAAIETDTERALVGQGGVAVLMNPTPGQVLTVDGAVSCQAVLPETLPGFDTVLTLDCKDTP